MKHIVLVILLCASAFAQDLKRPSNDSDIGSAIDLGCQGITTASSSMPLAYDAAGLSTSSSQSATKSYKGSQSKVRSFRGWTAVSGVYDSLTLGVNASSMGYSTFSLGGGLGYACVAYSINNGSTWTTIACDTDGSGFPQQTFSITLSPTQDLTKLVVGSCVGATAYDNPGDMGSDQLTIWDIWTVGVKTTPGPGPAGPGSSSGLPHRGVVIAN